jgi:hypothetical protein
VKQRLLTALAIRRQESTRTWWGVPYNPYGRGEYRWVYPLAFFDFEDEVMLGLTFWDFVGGTGTYESFSISIGKLETSSPNGFANSVSSSEGERPAGSRQVAGCGGRIGADNGHAGRIGDESFRFLEGEVAAPAGASQQMRPHGAVLAA